MKLNIANPATGEQKLIDFDDERVYRIFYEKKIAQEVDASPLGAEWAGYILRITGGNDKQVSGWRPVVAAATGAAASY